MRIGLLAAAGWLVAAVLTVAVSWSAVGVVRDAVSPTPVVAATLPTPDETATPTASPTATASRTTPAPGRTTSAPPAARPVSASGRGGSVVVRCSAGVPRFVNVTPRQGWTPRLDDSSPEVEFESSTGRTEITATCAGSVPRLSVEEKNPRGGGDDDNSGSGSDNSGPGGGDDD